MFNNRGYISLLILCFNTLLLRSEILYDATIENGTLTDRNNFEFDVYIKSTSGSFTITSYQCAITFHSKINNGGTLSFTYVAGSSELNIVPSSCIGISNENSIDKLTFASLPGNEIIGTSKKRIGKFKLQNTNIFGLYLANIINLKWNFNGITTTIFTGIGFSNITQPLYHKDFELFEKLAITSSTSSDTINSQFHPGKTTDGLGILR